MARANRRWSGEFTGPVFFGTGSFREGWIVSTMQKRAVQRSIEAQPA
ncbi:hypothetical protein ACFRFU_35405 [Streptomyces sp. NPDC056704]